MELILCHSNNLSQTLQKDNILATEEQEVTRLTVATLKSLRIDESFKPFWMNVAKFAADNDVAEPQLPRQ